MHNALTVTTVSSRPIYNLAVVYWLIYVGLLISNVDTHSDTLRQQSQAYTQGHLYAQSAFYEAQLYIIVVQLTRISQE